MAIQVEPGKVVQLKSGGPKMTVIGEESSLAGTKTGRVSCEWFDGQKHMHQAFNETSLKVVGES